MFETTSKKFATPRKPLWSAKSWYAGGCGIGGTRSAPMKATAVRTTRKRAPFIRMPMT
jgi:hypothetical protein